MVPKLGRAAFLLASCCVLAAPGRGAQDLPEPSANARKTGTYKCTTTHSGYNYYVCAPGSYSDEKPAGIYIFFHGQNGQGGAPHFHNTKQNFVNAHNIVAINMQYMDGDNAKDTGGKVDAAIEAIKQTMADYKIVAGRGIVASFSGGGLPHAGLFQRFQRGKGSAEGIAWPFNHVQLTGSNYRASASGAAPMSWYVGVGGGEWDMAKLGIDATARTSELYAMIAKGTYPADAYLKIIKEKGHSIDARDVQESAALFAVSDVLLAPFVYEPDFEERELAVFAAAANARRYKAVLARLSSIARKTSATPELRAKAARFEALVKERIARSVKVTTSLLGKDPIRGIYYGKLLASQLMGVDEGKQVRDAIRKVARDRALLSIYNVLRPFAKEVGSFFGGGATLKERAIPLLEQITSVASRDVLVGRMAAEYLEFVKK